MAHEPEVDAHVTLRDGRRLAYCDWGDRDGRPILLCHGAPGSRVFGPDAATTAKAGVRLITADRPGYGRSDPLPDRRILDWPADVEELTGALGVAEFDVAAHSSGGPYALACAYQLPERVQRVALISCVAPFKVSGSGGADEDLTRLARNDVAQAAREVARSAAWLVEAPERFLDLPRPEADRQLLTDPDIRSMFAATIREAVAQGTDAYGWECAVERLPWGFALDEIKPPVWIFQGEQDRSLPPSQARVLADVLPGNTLRVFPDQGHGLILARWAEILRDLSCKHPTSGPGGVSDT
jgi:pimeloyl-ACP methyl ester carboxylesterase